MSAQDAAHDPAMTIVEEESEYARDERRSASEYDERRDHFRVALRHLPVMSGRNVGGRSGHDLFNLTYTFIETIFLLLSSTTFGFAGVSEGGVPGPVLRGSWSLSFWAPASSAWKCRNFTAWS